MINQFYISSGAKNAQYTLRARYEDYGNDGTLQVFDRYVRNLGIDLDRARATAERETGCPVEVVPFDLNPYGQRSEAEISADAEREAREAEREALHAMYAAEAAEIIRKRQAENALSQWQASIGERITRKLTCLRWVALGQGAYGMRWLGIFRDAAMNKYVFFGGVAASLPAEGGTAEVVFTVKDHTEHDGCRQTVIARPAREKAN